MKDTKKKEFVEALGLVWMRAVSASIAGLIIFALFTVFAVLSKKPMPLLLISAVVSAVFCLVFVKLNYDDIKTGLEAKKNENKTGLPGVV